MSVVGVGIPVLRPLTGVPGGALVPERRYRPDCRGVRPGASGYTVIEDKCSGCGVCVSVCVGGAIRLA